MTIRIGRNAMQGKGDLADRWLAKKHFGMLFHQRSIGHEVYAFAKTMGNGECPQAADGAAVHPEHADTHALLRSPGVAERFQTLRET